MLYENEIIQALGRAIHSDFNTDKIFVKEIPFLYFTSTLHRKDNRRVVMYILGEEYEVYNKEAHESFSIVKQKTLYIIKNQLGSMFYQLEKILEKN